VDIAHPMHREKLAEDAYLIKKNGVLV
jgi:hypothetical protein